MNRYFTLLLITCMMFISGCTFVAHDEQNPFMEEADTNTHESGMTEENMEEDPSIEESKPEVTSNVEGVYMDEDEYWNALVDDIQSLFDDSNLFVDRVDSRIPYIKFYVEYGIKDGDNQFQPVGLAKTDYEQLVMQVKSGLMDILDQYIIEKPKGIFDSPSRSIIGIHFYNRYINELPNATRIEKHAVADYQINIVEYYYGGTYVRMDGFDDSPWEKYRLYTP